MAITLAQDLTGSDGSIALSADPGSPFIKIGAEQMAITQHAGGPTRTPFQPDGNTAGSGTYGFAIVSVTRGANGTDPAPHSNGAAVTPLFLSLTATAGATV